MEGFRSTIHDGLAGLGGGTDASLEGFRHSTLELTKALNPSATQTSEEFADSAALLGDAAALRDRAAADGYLFFRNLLPREAVLELRRDMLGVVGDFGWRQSDQGEMGGGIDLAKINEVPEEGMRSDIGVSIAAYHAAQKLQSLHRLPHHPQLVNLYRVLLGDEILVHPRHIARMITGHACMVPTPPHQDFPLIQGTAETWTAWFPLGDCPRPMGGLTVLRGSHRNGYVPIQPAKGAGGLAVPLCPWETDWVSGDFNAGDVLTFPSYTIHRALRCQHRDQIRLSLDVRYQRVSDPVEAKSLLPHCELTWEEIYAGWPDDELKYYWKRAEPTLSAWNEELIQPKRRIC